MTKFGFEVATTGEDGAKLPERLDRSKLNGKPFVRQKIQPVIGRQLPEKLPSLQDTLSDAAEYERVMQFAEEYGISLRKRRAGAGCLQLHFSATLGLAACLTLMHCALMHLCKEECPANTCQLE